jgi:hypothetical protein
MLKNNSLAGNCGNLSTDGFLSGYEKRILKKK